MIPRRFLRFTTVAALLIILVVLICLGFPSTLPKSPRLGIDDSKKGKTNVSTGSDCLSSKDPILLLLDTGRNRQQPLRYLDDCPHKCCFTTDYDGFIDKADLVAVATYELCFEPPKYYNKSTVLELQATNPKQVWLGVVVEPPEPQIKRGKELDGVFHWIGTHRMDADVFFSYGQFEKLGPEPGRQKHALDTWKYQILNTETSAASHHNSGSTKRSKKLASWLVSNCESWGRRELLVKHLQKYVQIDVYGRCGDFQCPTRQDCHDYLAENYKFYLAFENSLCVDYVTEKLWAQLERDIVPITYAWINTTHAFPPNSYINALDFGSLKELADYLNFLNENEPEYRKFFKWKEKYRAIDGGNGLCWTCEKLWELRQMRAISGAVVLKRHESLLTWLDTFPKNANSTGERYGTVEFRFGNRSKIIANTTCINPLDYDVLMNWMSDEK